MTDPLSLSDLKEYWQRLDDGESLIVLSTHDMPPWEKICSELNWYLYRGNSVFTKKRHGFCGVYRLVGLAADDDLRHPAGINRVCGTDSSGTLYVGEAGWLDERLHQLHRSLGQETSHNAGRMWRASETLNLKFPLRRLGIAILSTGVRSRKTVEENLIQAYLKSFGDTPPLNCSF